MSIRVDTTSLIAGALVVGDRGHGVLAEDIPSTGEHGAAYAYNDLSLPADNGKEIRGLVTSPPGGAGLVSFFAHEDTSVDLVVSADGIYSWTYELFVDGVSQGTAIATATIGAAGPSPPASSNPSDLWMWNGGRSGSGNAGAMNDRLLNFWKNQ